MVCDIVEIGATRNQINISEPVQVPAAVEMWARMVSIAPLLPENIKIKSVEHYDALSSAAKWTQL